MEDQSWFDESDQAGLFELMVSAHLKNHPDHKPHEDCAWCKAFLIETPEQKERREKGHKTESYYFMIFDVSNPGSTKVQDAEGNEYDNIEALMKAVDEKRKPLDNL